MIAPAARILHNCRCLITQADACLLTETSDRARNLITHARANYVDAMELAEDGAIDSAHALMQAAYEIVDQAVMAV